MIYRLDFPRTLGTQNIHILHDSSLGILLLAVPTVGPVPSRYQ